MDGTQSTISVPPAFLLFNPNGFFIWGYINNAVYFHPPTTKEEIIERVVNARKQRHCYKITAQIILVTKPF